MNPETEKNYQRLRSIFFGLCILAAGMLFLSSVNNIYKSKAAAQWIRHQATVTQEMGKGIRYYGGGWMEYAYEIHGKKYRGTRIGFGISRPPAELKKQQIIPIYVNPADHSEAVIVAGVVKRHFIGLLFSAGFLWMAFLIWRRTA